MQQNVAHCVQEATAAAAAAGRAFISFPRRTYFPQNLFVNEVAGSAHVFLETQLSVSQFQFQFQFEFRVLSSTSCSYLRLRRYFSQCTFNYHVFGLPNVSNNLLHKVWL